MPVRTASMPETIHAAASRTAVKRRRRRLRAGKRSEECRRGNDAR